LHLAETGISICNRNRIMTGVRFLFRVTLRRLDLAAEIYHLREPEKIPQVMSPDEMRRLLAVASSLKVRVLLSLGYGCGLRAGEIVRLKVKHAETPKNPNRMPTSGARHRAPTSRRRNPPQCPVQSWRSRISSATTGRRGAPPMPAVSALANSR